jgi:hypothetical protein
LIIIVSISVIKAINGHARNADPNILPPRPHYDMDFIRGCGVVELALQRLGFNGGVLNVDFTGHNHVVPGGGNGFETETVLWDHQRRRYFDNFGHQKISLGIGRFWPLLVVQQPVL